MGTRFRRSAVLGGALLSTWAVLLAGTAAAEDAPPPDAASPDTLAVEAILAVDDSVPPQEVPPTPPETDTMAGVYLMRCAGCHTIGGGALSGPDLRNAAGYPRQTVLDAVKRMEKNVGPLQSAEVESLVEFILDPEAAARVKKQQEQAALREAATLEPGSVEKGRALFLGRASFQNGGVSCAACHQAGGRGGNLAASLEDAFTRLGEQSLLATAQNPGFPVMRAIYEAQPVTKQEAIHLAKFLEEAALTPAPPAQVPLHLAGLAGTVAIMVLLGRSRSKRAAGTRARMVAEAQRRSNRSGQSRRGL